MTHTEANHVLDAARDGAEVSTLEITRALAETGDADGCFESISIEVRALAGPTKSSQLQGVDIDAVHRNPRWNRARVLDQPSRSL